MKPRDYQQIAINNCLNHLFTKDGNPVNAMPTGCHAFGQKILMFDGTIKEVQDIVIGDLLMGPDSKPKTVLNLYRGQEILKKIKPKKGEPWIVNNSHILALYKTQEKNSTRFKCRQAKYFVQSVFDYEQSSDWHKHVSKLYRVGVDFGNNEQLPIDSYFLGLFLGDGSYSQAQVNFTSQDLSLSEYWVKVVSEFGDFIRVTSNGSKANTYHVTTKIRHRSRRTNVAAVLDKLGLRDCLSGTKFIPQIYKTSNRKDRLLILAGLLDTDGSISCNGYDFISKSETLANDVCFVARSLGLAAYTAICKKASQTGYVGDYYRVSITGNVSEIPIKLEYKKAKLRQQKKNVLFTGFSIEDAGYGDYYGFELNGDHLYLLDDFTVTHNTGKALIVGGVIQQSMYHYPRLRTLMITGVKELVTQNSNTLIKMWAGAPLGVCCSGLKRKDTMHPIIYGSIGTMINQMEAFGHRDFIQIDECHLVNPKENTMFFDAINIAKRINPKVKVLGHSATIYRLGQGLITENGIFTDVCNDMTSIESFNWFISEGYLSPLFPSPTKTTLDVTKVSIQNGDYNKKQLQDAVNKRDVTLAALQEAVSIGADKKSWLCFASGVQHAEEIVEMLEYLGISAAAIHSDKSKCSDEERAQRISDFKFGKIRCLVNNNVLTTGFDHPNIDLIIMLRPTTSPGLWVQMLGRGTRPVYMPGYDLSTREGRIAAIMAGPKQYCTVLDFAGNTYKLGPINDPTIPKAKGKTAGEAPAKLCENCNTYNHTKATHCIRCGAEFTFKVKISSTASTEALIVGNEQPEEIVIPIVEQFSVDYVTYSKHIAKGSKNVSLKVNYYCGFQRFTEWVALDAKGIVKHHANNWWRERCSLDIPIATESESVVDQALKFTDQFAMPKQISVWVNQKYPKVMRYEY